ncbi:MAG TPA: DNA helicase RecG, partial [Candidatus Omnitrophica bacterium]|nr:DNA helicase RecG [Candidatus Omnitrophota bacterium]
GRIGRGGFASTCLLISDTADELAAKRLQAFVETTDGFQLAERDLQLRGPGELLGRRQHGWMRFRLADLSRDAGLLELARQEATAEVTHHPEPLKPSRS